MNIFTTLLSPVIFDFGNVYNIISFIVGIVLFAVFDVIAFIWFKRKFVRSFLIIDEALIILFWLFGLDLPFAICSVLFLFGLLTFYISNSSAGRNLTANNFKGKTGINFFQHKSKTRPETLFDRDAVYKKIETAVITLSKQKVGALITFEKKDLLTDVMKSGTIINAPVSAELLQTIFYPGTRLHDGAVIVKNDMILAASVYFTPTTRPLTGKYGSRHRAAIGISEVCDAVTVVVSEETGRISIAYQGELQTVGPDTFLSTFEDYMMMSDEEDKNSKKD